MTLQDRKAAIEALHAQLVTERAALQAKLNDVNTSMVRLEGQHSLLEELIAEQDLRTP